MDAGAPGGHNGSNNDDGTFSRKAFLKIEKAKLEFCNIQRHRAHEFDERITYVLRATANMKKLLESQDVQFAVAVYPDELQVNDRLFEDLVSTFGLQKKDYDVGMMQKILSDYLEDAHIPYLDLLPEFRHASRNKRLYLTRNTHWNRPGNELAADAIFRFLMDKQLIVASREAA